MAKLLNTFTRAMVSQVGRDTGKLVSNSLYGDKHATPIRHVGQSGKEQLFFLVNEQGAQVELSVDEYRANKESEGWKPQYSYIGHSVLSQIIGLVLKIIICLILFFVPIIGIIPPLWMAINKLNKKNITMYRNNFTPMHHGGYSMQKVQTTMPVNQKDKRVLRLFAFVYFGIFFVFLSAYIYLSGLHFGFLEEKEYSNTGVLIFVFSVICVSVLIGIIINKLTISTPIEEKKQINNADSGDAGDTNVETEDSIETQMACTLPIPESVKPTIEPQSFSADSNENYVIEDIATLGEYDPTLELSNYKTPPLELLADYKSDGIVSMRPIITSRQFWEAEMELPIALGKTTSNETFVFDLAKMPHLLVAGATGQGKSVSLNVIITSILYKKHPSQVKLVLIDPKSIEFTLYGKIENHFLAKVPDSKEAIVTKNDKAIYTINSLCVEMEARYSLLKDAGVRNIKEYNTKFITRKLSPNRGHHYLPYIIIIIDEYYDLMMAAGKEIEMPIVRLAQMARVTGIHLVIATQRPTTNVITGLIKANFSARIAFRVFSQVDSRTILDRAGANQLNGQGDLLFTSGGDPTRVQCAFIDTPETEEITNFIGKQQGYPSALVLPEYTEESGEIKDIDLCKKDDLFDDAARLLVAHQQGSTSLIQRKFSIGFNRAGRIMEQLESAGIIGPNEGDKARQVLFGDMPALENYLAKINLK